MSVGQTTRQRINYFYVNEAISMSEHRAPICWFQVAMVSFTAYCATWASAGGQNGHLPPLEIRITNQIFLENLKLAAKFRLIHLIVAMTVDLPV